MTDQSVGIDITILQRLIGKPNPVIFEIGAHQGEDSRNLSNLFPNGKLYLFEPDSRAYEKLLAQNIPNANLFKMAISDLNSEETVFYTSGGSEGIYRDWDGSSSLIKPKEHINYFPSITFSMSSVQSRTLDWIVENTNIDLIDFIWMDVQGAEEKIFKGGKDTVKNRVRLIYTEFCAVELYENSPSLSKIIEILEVYEVLGIYELNQVSGNALLKNKTL